MPHEPDGERSSAGVPARSDGDLAAAACAGSPEAYEALVARYEGRLFNFLLRRTADADRAEEIAQAAFVRAWQYLDRYDPQWRFSTWLYTIARNLDRAAQASRGSVRPPARAPAEIGDESADDPAKRMLAAEARRTVWDEVDRRFDADTRAALWLRYADEMPIRHIAEAIGRTPGATRILLHRARRELAAALEEKDRMPDGSNNHDGRSAREPRGRRFAATGMERLADDE